MPDQVQAVTVHHKRGPKPVIYTLWGKPVQGLDMVAKRAGISEKWLRANADRLYYGDITHEVERLKLLYKPGKRGPEAKTYIFGEEKLTSNEISVRTSIPARTVCEKLTSLEAGVDCKPLFDALVKTRSERAADPNRDGKKIKLLYRGIPFASKHALALALVEEFFVLYKTAVKFLWPFKPGDEVGPAVDNWQEADAIRAKIALWIAAGFESHQAQNAVKNGLILEHEIERRNAAVGMRVPAAKRPMENWTPEILLRRFNESGHGSGKLSNLDFSNAYPVKRGEDKFYRVTGLVCREHGPLEMCPAISNILQGQQPCCHRDHRRTGPRGKKRVRSLQLLRELLAELNCYTMTQETRLIRAADMGRKGSDHYIEGLECGNCHKVLDSCAWVSAVRGSVPCPKCKKKEAVKIAKRRVQEVHGDHVALENYGGKVNASSIFRCAHSWCNTTWSTSLSAVIGAGSQPPTGCPSCGKRGRTEAIVKGMLNARNIAFSYQHPLHLPDRARALRADFFLPSLSITIEVDGEQHYQVKDNWKAAKLAAFNDLRERDTAKCRYLESTMNVKTCRLPYWCWDNLEYELDRILAGIPTYVGTPEDAERHLNSFNEANAAS